MEQIKNYFNAEKYESLLFVSVGLIAIGISVYLLLNDRKPFSIGISMPLIAIALIQLIVGFTVYVRSPKDIERVTNMVNVDRSSIQTEEIPRMKVVAKNFVIYRCVEILLMIVGLTLMFVFQKNEMVNGIGIGLFIQSALMLSLDFFAEKRGNEYLQFLLTL